MRVEIFKLTLHAGLLVLLGTFIILAASAYGASQVPQYILDKIAREKQIAAQSSRPATAQQSVQSSQPPQNASGTNNQSLTPLTSTARTPATGGYGVYNSGQAAATTSTIITTPIIFSGSVNPTGQNDTPTLPPGKNSASEYPWKVATPFEISFIDGFQGVYQTGEPIIFHVEGRSPVQVDALPENGFNVAATIYDVPRSRTVQSMNASFDESRRAWHVSFAALADNTKTYEVEIHLYCGKDESKCAEIYGRSAQTTKLLPLIIN